MDGTTRVYRRLLTKMRMESCNPTKTLMNAGDHHVTAKEEDETQDQQEYLSNWKLDVLGHVYEA